MAFSFYGNSKKRKVACEVCGKLFETSHPHKKTCSDTCSLIREEQTHKEANENTKRYNKKRKK